MPSFWVCLRIQFAQTLFLPCHLISDVPATFPFGRILTSPFQPWVTFFFIVTHPPSPTVPCECWLGSSNLLSYALGLMSSWNYSVTEVHICVCARCMFWICTLIFWYLQRDLGALPHLVGNHPSPLHRCIDPIRWLTLYSHLVAY